QPTEDPSPHTPASDPQPVGRIICDQLRAPFGMRPQPIDRLAGIAGLGGRLPPHDHLFASRNLFFNARRYFLWSGRFLELKFDSEPDILHCTYQLPLRAKAACNIYTIHDLVPLRLPDATRGNQKRTYRLLHKIATEADHIVTVSEHSKRDIVELLGVDEKRVTNTYEAVEFPREFVERPDDVIAEQLRGSFGLMPKNYLLFYGALEPKKNVQ